MNGVVAKRIFLGLTLVALGATVALALWGTPSREQQGEDAVRLLYLHVPTAWVAYLAFGITALCSLLWLIPRTRSAKWDLLAGASAEVGVLFTAIMLIVGSLWGKPTWGTWWEWDARLTTSLIMFFLYLGYIALVNAFDDPVRGYRAAAILALVGVVNLPIIKFSVDWWNTLHQPASVLRLDGPAIHPAMLWPLLLMAAGFTLFFVTVLILRVRGEIAAAKVRNLQLSLAQG